MQAIEPYDCDVGAFADFQSSDFVLQSQSLSTFNCGDAQGQPCVNDLRPVHSLLQKRHGAHLCEHIEPVVTGRSICTKRNRNSQVEHFGDLGNPGTEFEIGRGAMGNVSSSVDECLKLRRIEMYAMG